MLYGVLQRLTFVAARVLFRLEASGLEYVPASGPVMLASNHSSLLDPPLVGSAAPRPLHYMAKAELFRVPLLGPLIRRLNSHPVDRSGSDAQALRLARSLLEAGHALLVFPEGTRGPEGALRRGRPGVGLLAAQSGAPVVPVLVQGSGRALPRGAVLPRPTRVTVTCGPPLRFARGRGRERYQTISDEIMAAIARLGNRPDARGDEHGVAVAPGDDRGASALGRLPAGQIH